MLNFHSAFWLLEPYFSLIQPSCCKICVFFHIYVYIFCCLDLCFSGFLLLESKHPIIQLFPTSSILPISIWSNPQLSRNSTKLKVPYFCWSIPTIFFAIFFRPRGLGDHQPVNGAAATGRTAMMLDGLLHGSENTLC